MSFNFFKYQRRFCSSLHNYRSIDNPRVFLEFSKDGKSLGKMVFEVITNNKIIIITKNIFSIEHAKLNH